MVNKVITQQLTEYTWIRLGLWQDTQLPQVGHLLWALSNAIKTLKYYYQSVNVSHLTMPTKFLKPSPNTDPEQSPDTTQHLFLYCQSYPAASGQVNFKYTGCLKMRTPIFTAIQDDRKEIVVKFVDQYNVKAHRLLANSNLAPKLYYVDEQLTQCQAEGLSPLVPHLKMVVMEWEPSLPADAAFATTATEKPQTEHFLQDVTNAIEILQQENLVFGDLRPTNILVVRPLKQAKLIDFDWCGEDRRDIYPASLNDWEDIEWPTGVGQHAIMQPSHDNVML